MPSREAPTSTLSHCSRGASACQRCRRLCMALFIVALLRRTGCQAERQQATVVALQIEAAELTTLQRLAAPEAFQIQRKQLLILAQPAQPRSEEHPSELQ